MLELLNPLRPSIFRVAYRAASSSPTKEDAQTIRVKDKEFSRDFMTNVTDRVISKMDAKLLSRKNHPLCLLKERICHYFYTSHQRKRGYPLFTTFDDISPVVTPHHNFDSLLVPIDHISRSVKDSYYINQNWMLRCHTTAHDASLINMGIDAFITFGDVYRRDAIDSTHYPVFHQADGVRLFSSKELFARANDPDKVLQLMESRGTRSDERQECHTLETAKMLEFELKSTLEGLATALFGKSVDLRWVDAYFPFTHPSWEMEVRMQDEWVEMLGCGILEQNIINEAGALGKVGWAFGLGMERWAMRLYSIPDIRIFWSNDTGITSQFEVDDIHQNVVYKQISIYPACITDMSFWLPSGEDFSENDFYEIVRTVGGDQVEQVRIIDDFTHPKTSRRSHCYRIVYRDMSKTLTQNEVNVIHGMIGKQAEAILGVELR